MHVGPVYSESNIQNFLPTVVMVNHLRKTAQIHLYLFPSTVRVCSLQCNNNLHLSVTNVRTTEIEHSYCEIDSCFTL